MKKFRLTGSSWDEYVGTVVTAYPHDYVGTEVWNILEPYDLRGALIDHDNTVFPPPHDFTAEEVTDNV